MITRRSFFGAIAALITIPYTVTKISYGLGMSASNYLTKAWNDHHKGKCGQLAKNLIVSPDLFDKFESEFMPLQRFYLTDPTAGQEDGRKLAFKCCNMRASDKLTGWDYIFI
jgi:hypothetical protein